MDYEIRYFRSPDGASVAGARGGDGPPLVIGPSFGSTIETDWAIYTAAFPNHELITWDRRGFGLSERGSPCADAEPYLQDAQAVVDGFGPETFRLVGTLMGAVEATWLAANNPERATQLVLRVPSTGMADWAAIPGVAAGLAALEHDWEYFTESFAQFVLGWGEPGAPKFAAKFGAITTRDELKAMFDAFIGLDLIPMYPRIRAAALIEHNPAYFFPQSMSRRVAGMIHDCQLSIYSGPRSSFMSDFSLARQFLAGPGSRDAPGLSGRQTMSREGEKRRLSAILIADIAGYTRLVEKDTDGTLAAWKSARDGDIEPQYSIMTANW